MRRIFRLPPRTAADARADADEELASFLDERTASLVARGADPDAARDEALRRLGAGTVARARERLHRSAERRDARVRLRDAVDRVRQDVRFALRQLAAAPGFTAVAAITLALGIGASTAIFSAVNPVLFEPLPYPHAERVVTVWDQGVDGSRLEMTFGSFRELAARARSYDAVAVLRAWQPTLSGLAEAERLAGQRVSAGYFRTLGISPALGRDLSAEDDQVGGPRVVVLADGLWRRRFGADATIVGRQITLDDDAYTVVGVMPRALENVLAPDAELWTPLQYPVTLPSEGEEWGHNLRMIGRLRAGVSADAARRELDAIARNGVPEFVRPRWATLRRGLTLTTLQDDVTRGVRPALLAVLGAVLLVLAIACVNVTNLLLARGAARRAEFAMRAAIGAGRGRMVRQLLTESVVLCAVGGALGVAVAAAGTRALLALAPPGLPRAHAVALDARALAFALGVTLVVGLAVGAAPALHAVGRGLHAGLQRGSRRTAGGGAHDRTRRGLVVAEFALALVLLVSAGLLLRSMQRLLGVATGFAPERLLTMQVHTSGRRFDDDATVHRFFSEALDAVRQVPGVTSAAWTSELPLSGDGDQYGVHFESSPTGHDEGDVFRYAVSPGYFRTMGIPLRRGRVVDSTDVRDAPLAAVINESFARQKFPGRDAVGQHIHIGPDRGPWFTIVGVVGDVKQLSLAASDAHAVYITTDQSWFADRDLSLVVRATGDPAALAPAVKRAVWSVDRDQPITRVATMDALVAASAAQRRFALVLFEAFALVSLALAAIGIYGVLAGSVAERSRELGVRSALGASRLTILTLELRRGAALAVLGTALGLAGAAAASRMLETLLFGVSRLDAVTYGGVVALLAGVALLACAGPAWRAARTDPAVTLRGE